MADIHSNHTLSPTVFKICALGIFGARFKLTVKSVFVKKNVFGVFVGLTW